VSLPVAVVALILGIIVWFLLVRNLRTKSWEPQPATGEMSAEDEENRTPAVRIGLRVFLAVVTSLFGLFLSAYYMRMGHGHGADSPVRDWVAISDPPILWLNTLLLVAGSIAMQSAKSAVRNGDGRRTGTALLTAGLLTFAFLIGQFVAWRELRYSSAFTPGNPAVAFFYVLTAVHGLHLLGGLYVWGRTVRRLRDRAFELIDLRLSVELCTTYWHYLLLIWIGVFAVLLST
jgi:cytochrome c oxidase subunit III